jgi:hypothetical protein
MAEEEMQLPDGIVALLGLPDILLLQLSVDLSSPIRWDAIGVWRVRLLSGIIAFGSSA